MTNLNRQVAVPPRFDSIIKKVPFGCCHCGCGHKTTIARRNDKQHGWVKGQPIRFLKGHESRTRQYRTLSNPNPSGLCQCNCGQKTPIAKQSHMASGCVRGCPMRFCRGHRIESLGRRLPVKKRLMDRIRRMPGRDGCWLWTAGKDTSGYGSLSVNGVDERTHRISFEVFKGPIPPNAMVLHTCDTPACIRPKHLFLGDDEINRKDKMAKGRQAKGEKIHTAKLTVAGVKRLRQMRGRGYTLNELSKEFGLGTSQISRVCTGKFWQHVQ